MEIKWKRSESTEYPVELDTGSSPNTIYVRRNIREVEHENGEDTVLFYEYDEAEPGFSVPRPRAGGTHIQPPWREVRVVFLGHLPHSSFLLLLWVILFHRLIFSYLDILILTLIKIRFIHSFIFA